MTALDPRLHAYRDDLADLRLEDRVTAGRFVAGTRMQVERAIATLRREPDGRSPADSELLLGETVRVFEETGGWAWCQSEIDGYVGYVERAALRPEPREATHWVTALRSFLYPEPELRRTPLAALSLGSRVTVVDTARVRDLDYAILAGGGAVVARHLGPVAVATDADFVAVAERFLETPYQWAGRSSIGLDCSALVQLALMMTGTAAPRDSDMQQESLGTALDPRQGTADLERGDLVFWRGHVGIMADPSTLLHASGYRMTVVRDSLAEVVARLERAGLPPVAVRRGGGPTG